MHEYNVNDLVRVQVHPGVNPILQRSIDFQLVGFRTDSSAASAPLKIAVRPFGELPPIPQETLFFNETRFIAGKESIDDAAGTAVISSTEGFEVFTDRADVLINLFLHLLLMPLGATIIHSAGVADDDGNVLLLAGSGGVGKTTLVGFLINQRGFRFLGDDMVCVRADGTCLPFLRGVVLKGQHREIFPDHFQSTRRADAGRRVRWTMVNVIRENAPFVGFAKWLMKKMGWYAVAAQRIPESPDLKWASPLGLFGPERIASEGLISRAVHLTRYSGAVTKVSPLTREDLSNRLFSTIHHEVSTILRPLMAFGAMEISDPMEYFERTRDVIRSSLSAAEPVEMLIPAHMQVGALPEEFITHCEL